VPGRVAEGAALAAPPVYGHRINPGANDRSAIEVMAMRPVADLADNRRTWGNGPCSQVYQRVLPGRLIPRVSDRTQYSSGAPCVGFPAGQAQ
jgi:hypothetical protein